MILSLSVVFCIKQFENLLEYRSAKEFVVQRKKYITKHNEKEIKTYEKRMSELYNKIKLKCSEMSKNDLKL